MTPAWSGVCFRGRAARRVRCRSGASVHRELRRKDVTLPLLWQEYKALHPEGLQYNWFCDQYRAWSAKLDLVMRQEHRAGGEKPDPDPGCGRP